MLKIKNCYSNIIEIYLTYYYKHSDFESDSKYNCRLLHDFHDNSTESFFQIEPKIKLSYKEINKHGWNFNFQIYYNFQASETWQNIFVHFSNTNKQ